MTTTTKKNETPRPDRLRLAFIVMICAEAFVACEGDDCCPLLWADDDGNGDGDPDVPDEVGRAQAGVDAGDDEPAVELALTAGSAPELRGNEAEAPIGATPSRRGPESIRATPGSDDDLDAGPISIVAGDEHSCALLDTGEIYCWGVLAGLDVDPILAPIQIPTRPSLGEEVVSLAAGGDTSCALLSSGDLGCWGPQPWQRIQLPVAIETLNVADDHGCGLAVDELWCWELERGADGDIVAALSSAPLASELLDFSLSSTHGCVVLADGELSCWEPEANDPAPLVGVREPATAIATEMSRICMLGEDADISCWTLDPLGPEAADTSELELIELGADEPALELALGHAHGCARFDDGLRCWGQNDHGQLGLGSPARSSGKVELPSPVEHMAVGGEHVCALLETHEIYCWGRGDLGQLGHGKSEDIGDDEVPTAMGPVRIPLIPRG